MMRWGVVAAAVLCGLRLFVLPVGTSSDAAPEAKSPSGHRMIASGESEEAWKNLVEGNVRFVEGTSKRREFVARRHELAAGQHPKAIVLTCSDSRLSPEIIFDQSLGDIFVVRTAGNVADPVALGSIEYAAEHLHAKLLVVLGHEGCGAVKAAAGEGDMPSPNLQAIVQLIRPAISDLGTEAEKGGLKGVRANVRAVSRRIKSDSKIVEHLEEKKELEIVDAVYHLYAGKVERVAD